MTPKALLVGSLVVGLLAWAIEAAWIASRNVSLPKDIAEQGEVDRHRIALDYAKQESELSREYEKRRYLATGETVCDRIYNAKAGTLEELIRSVAVEVLPEEWSADVQVDDFTHFILLISAGHSVEQIEPARVALPVRRVLKYCSPWLTDVAVLDGNHKSYLFLDADALHEIERTGAVSSATADRVKKLGRLFSRFNSVTVQCQAIEGHLVVPMDVAGVSCQALLDTGASMTLVPRDIAASTGQTSISNARRESFRTANGLISCAVVTRTVDVGGFRREIEVAVDEGDDPISLLGVNFFEGLHYVVDFQNSCIHLWED